jgi:hypothetical protein
MKGQSVYYSTAKAENNVKHKANDKFSLDVHIKGL